MKLLKIFGIVAGIHAVALLLIFMNPGCSSSTAQPAPAAAPVKPDDAPSISVPITAAPADAGVTPAPIIAAPVAPEVSSPAAGVLFKPTRPGTPAAAALETQPVGDVTPASTYTVVKGDSLWSVAKKNHIKVSELAASNGLHSGATLHLGQKLIVPAKSPAVAPGAAAAPEAVQSPAAPAKAKGEALTHVVKSGETLGSIARKYGVRLGDLAAANAISDPKTIHPGQELTIPAGGRAASKSSGSASRAAAAAATPAPATPVPAAGQDLDSGLKSAPASEIPVIKIEPEQPAATPAPSDKPAPAKMF